ncbi:hypothetical protein AURDEDRAFT_187383 [Auricularia subglabra TFB-10046 SS5]|nr:hypothetical protein AURDEDRAFT_187383 [Auricularia subglabra TFB-10046 SS5]
MADRALEVFMLVIDYPTIHDRPVDFGTFVIIAVDPLASVVDLYDDEATRQAAAIEPTRCLAIVDNVSGNEMHELFPGMFTDGLPTLKPSVQMWVNVSPEDTLGTPEQFEKGMRRLREIEWEWAQRTIAAVLSKQPQTSAWLEGAAHADEPVVQETASVSTAGDSIAPEDAIEHRIEREGLEHELPSQDPGASIIVSSNVPPEVGDQPSAASPPQTPAVALAARTADASAPSAEDSLPSHSKTSQRLGLFAPRSIMSRAKLDARRTKSRLGSLASKLRSVFRSLLSRKQLST